MTRKRSCTVLAAMVLVGLWATASRAFEETEAYQSLTLEEWTVRVSPRMLDRPELSERVLALLRVKLFDANRALPAAARDRLRESVVVWVELEDKRFPGMCYHPSARWLRQNGYNPAKAGGIEISNARNFLTWTREQPAMVLHELAHAYFHRVITDEDRQAIRSAYERAKREGIYDEVLRANGRVERAYAMNNVEEYFAELSEAYLGTNDFYPFVRAELREHDRAGYDAVRRAWGERDRPASAPATTQAARGPEAENWLSAGGGRGDRSRRSLRARPGRSGRPTA